MQIELLVSAQQNNLERIYSQEEKDDEAFLHLFLLHGFGMIESYIREALIKDLFFEKQHEEETNVIAYFGTEGVPA